MEVKLATKKTETNEEVKETKTTRKTTRRKTTTTKPKETKKPEETVKETPKEEEKKEKQTYTPAEYFSMVKDRIHEETPENIRNLYDTCMKKLKKYMITGQKVAAKELYAKCLYLEKEMQVIEKGITQYVLRDDVDEYIDKVADRCVCIVEMENYERDIPDDIVDKVSEVMDLFDVFFVIFTDYTGEKRSKVAQEKREKDPILCGSILIDGAVGPKLYYIGSWIDEFCDLTLDKMIEEMTKTNKKTKEEILYDIDDYSNLDNIEKELFGTTKRVSLRTKEGSEKANA